jgi:F0F1-type ATP synthase beta subunit
MLLWLSVISVFADIGEHTREGNDMYREIIESGFCLLLTWGRS